MTWDIDIVFKELESKYHLEKLHFQSLSKKIVVLIALTTGFRV